MKFTRFIVHIVSISLLLISSSCNKDENNEDENDTVTIEPFSVQFLNGYGKDYGWIVLHSLDGSQILDYKKYVGDAMVDFGNVNSPITVTTIRVDTTSSMDKDISYYVNMATDIASPAGNWIFNNTSYYSTNLGHADITLNYPENDYSYLFTSCYGFTSSTYNIHPEETNLNFDINFLDPTGNFSFFSYVTSEDGSLCNWSLDNTFQTTGTNFYSLYLNKPLSEKIITSNLPLTHLYLSAYWNQRDSYLRISHSDITTQELERKVLYPVDMPAEEMQLRAYIISDNYQSFYVKYEDYSNNLPDAIQIPESSLTASFSEDNQAISNIQVSGNTDQVRGYWGYSDVTMDNLINWKVYANKNITQLSRPGLPQEITDEIGFLIDQMEIYSVAMMDYNTTQSHTDIINRFFIQNVPINQRYDESYVYFYNNEQNKLTEEEKEMLLMISKDR